MRKRIFLFIVLIILTIFSVSCNSKEDKNQTLVVNGQGLEYNVEEKISAKDYVFPKMNDPALYDGINQMCKEYFEYNNLMGFSVGVLLGGEVSYYNYGYSKDGGKPINENSIFEIASLTKTFTGIMLADMELEGLLHKTDTAQKYLKEKAELPRYGSSQITLQDLATHSSDLSRNPYNLFDDFETSYDNEYDNLTIEDVYEAVGHEYLRYEPGTNYTYSNFAFGLLGQIMCDIEGKTYDQMLEDRITSVLGMKNTRSELTRKQKANRTTGHNSNLREMVNFHFGALEACGSIKSTTSDMIRYLAANLEILDSKLSPAIKEAHEVHFIGNGKTVGLGWNMFSLNGDIVYDHNGITPGYRSSILFIKDKNVGIMLMTNTAHKLNDINIDLLTYLQNYLEEK